MVPSRVWKKISSTRVTPPTVSVEPWGNDPMFTTVSALLDAARAGRLDACLRSTSREFTSNPSFETFVAPAPS